MTHPVEAKAQDTENRRPKWRVKNHYLRECHFVEASTLDRAPEKLPKPVSLETTVEIERLSAMICAVSYRLAFKQGVPYTVEAVYTIEIELHPDTLPVEVNSAFKRIITRTAPSILHALVSQLITDISGKSRAQRLRMPPVSGGITDPESIEIPPVTELDQESKPSSE